jgi:hypothetical protein
MTETRKADGVPGQDQGRRTMRQGNKAAAFIRRATAGRRRAVALATTGLAAGAAVTALALPAGAASLPARPAVVSGTQHFQMMTTSPTATKTSLIAYGALTAPGTDKQNPNGTDTFVFHGGTIGLKHTPGKGQTKQSFNPKTCLLQVSEKGTYKLTGGTGKYKGVSGSGTYALSIIGIGAKLKNGACNPSQNAVPIAWHQEINAVGKIKLP